MEGQHADERNGACRKIERGGMPEVLKRRRRENRRDYPGDPTEELGHAHDGAVVGPRRVP